MNELGVSWPSWTARAIDLPCNPSRYHSDTALRCTPIVRGKQRGTQQENTPEPAQSLHSCEADCDRLDPASPPVLAERVFHRLTVEHLQ